jgi:hypothetical protein
MQVKFGLGRLKERDQLEGLDVDERLILRDLREIRWLLKK